MKSSEITKVEHNMMMNKNGRVPFSRLVLRGMALLSGVLLWGATPALAWWPEGHSIVATAAVQSLPAEMPEFFRNGSGLIAHTSQDPDIHRNRATPIVTEREDAEHYIDLELLQGHELPATYTKFLELCAQLEVRPAAVGFAPYAIAEWTERLAIAFAEHRKWPNNPHIQAKALVYAGILSHYAADLQMPLHTTLHHDGPPLPDGKPSQTGLHAKLDSLIEKLNLQPAELAKDQQIQAMDELMPGIVAALKESHSLVGETYRLDKQFPPETGAWEPTPEAREFGTSRARETTRFIASLYVTAWQLSEKVRLPPWIDRK